MFVNIFRSRLSNAFHNGGTAIREVALGRLLAARIHFPDLEKPEGTDRARGLERGTFLREFQKLECLFHRTESG